jgi:hypothetical protein
LEARRLWGEALSNALIHLVQRVIDAARWLMYTQLIYQFFVTIVQTLGVHFREGTDVVGLFPRYWHNVFSLQSLLGTEGLFMVIAHYKFVFGWYWDWFVGLTVLFAWYVPGFLAKIVWKFLVRAVTVPEEGIAGDD